MTSRFEASAQLPTAVVAGGLSFIGALVCERLLDLGVEVICADALSLLTRTRLKKIGRHPRFHFLDITSGVNAFNRITRAHYIFHCLAEDSFAAAHPENNFPLGIHGVKKVLGLTEKFSAKYLLVLPASGSNPIPQVTDLNKFHRPTFQTEKHYSLIEIARLTQALVAAKVRQKGIDARVLWLFDVFGPEMKISKGTPLGRLFLSLKQNSELPVEGDGLGKLYPTYSFDAVEGILKAMFSSGSKHKVFFLGAKEPTSQLNAALLIRSRANHPHQISYGKDGSQGKALSQGKMSDSSHELRWKPKILFSDGVDQTIHWLKTLPAPVKATAKPSLEIHTKLKPLKKTAPDPRAITPLSHPRTSYRESPTRQTAFIANQTKGRRFPLKRIVISLIVLAIISPLVGLSLSLAIATASFRGAIAALSQANFTEATLLASRASHHLEATQATLALGSPIASALHLQGVVFRLEKLLSIATNLTQAITHLSQGSASGLEALQTILGQKTGNSLSSLNSAQSEITRAYELLSLAESQLSDSRPRLEQASFFGIGGYYQNLKESIPSLRHRTQIARSLLTMAPKIIGLDVSSKKTYLVLLQNNAELRPTGGFIGSFALITFENGQLLDFLVEDVYTADGQLQGHVEPPEPIKKHLGEATWYLRDVNWDPDFPTTARQAEWFLQKEIGRTVDGTLAINLYVIESILESLGEIHLTDYDETITAANLFSRAEYHSEIDFFPGSTQKKDFLSSLARHLYNRLQSMDSNQALNLASNLARSIDESQLLVSFTDPTLDEQGRELGWGGQVIDQALCSKKATCLKDYLGIVEANLGVNKANFFITRRLNHQVKILQENSLTATTTIHYVNQSQADTWPAGDYKNYLRLYVPPGSTLQKLVVNNQQVDTSTVDTTLEHGKTVFGLPLTVPIKDELTVSISYNLPEKLTFTNQNPLAEYTLFFQKQSGTSDDPVFVELSYPSYLKPVAATPNTATSPQITTWETTNQKNRQFSLVFTR